MANRKFFNCGMLIDPLTKLVAQNAKLAEAEGKLKPVICMKAFKNPQYLKVH